MYLGYLSEAGYCHQACNDGSTRLVNILMQERCQWLYQLHS